MHSKDAEHRQDRVISRLSQQNIRSLLEEKTEQNILQDYPAAETTKVYLEVGPLHWIKQRLISGDDKYRQL